MNIFGGTRIVRRLLLPVLLLALLWAPGGTAVSQTLSVQHNIKTPDVATGRQLFERHCAICHGIDGKGGRGPSLNRVRLTHAPDETALKALIADGIPPAMPPGFFFTDDDLTNLSAYVRSLSKIPPEHVPGDAARGARIYAQAGCGNCHILAGVGTGYGPELTDIGVRRSPSHIRQTILNPESTISEGFLLVQAITASGEAIRGIRVNEDTFTIQIKDVAGQFHSLRKHGLQELRKLRGQTPMPSFEKSLQPSELQDLVAYLASLRGNE